MPARSILAELDPKRESSWRPKGGLVPVAALTAYASSEDRLRMLEAGCHAHIAKPVEPAELALVVARLAKLSRG